VQKQVQQMLELMGLELTVKAEIIDSGIDLEFEGADEEALTREEGELVSAIQFLLNRMSRRAWPSVGRIRLCHNGRGEVRDDEVIELVNEVAQQVSRTGEAKRLHPMNAYERRLVHLTIRKAEGLGSRSEGSGYLKKVKIFKK